jgi:NAD(P)-dependent dehydrogenase (short-subunit alcohol dehydrogenase family)
MVEAEQTKTAPLMQRRENRLGGVGAPAPQTLIPLLVFLHPRVDYLVDRIPVKRPGEPRDLDGPIVFLASEASRYITGRTLLVDGGISTGATRAMVQQSPVRNEDR